MSYTTIPYASARFVYEAAQDVVATTGFKAVILGELKRLRKFYKSPSLVDFTDLYTPAKVDSALKGTDGEVVVYAPGGIDTASLPTRFNYPGLSNAQQAAFEVDPDLTLLAMDNIKWESLNATSLRGLGVLPYVTALNAIASSFIVGTVTQTTLTGTVSVPDVIPESVLVEFSKDSEKTVLLYVNVAALTTSADILSGSAFDKIKILTGSLADVQEAGVSCTITYNTDGSVTFTIAGSPTYTIKALTMTVANASNYAISDDESANNSIMVFSNIAVTDSWELDYNVARTIQGYVVNGYSERKWSANQMWSTVKEESLEGLSFKVWKSTSSTPIAMFMGDSEGLWEDVKLVTAACNLYVDYVEDVIPLTGLVGNYLDATALQSLATAEYPYNTSVSPFLGDVHVSYSATFVDDIRNAVYKNTAAFVYEDSDIGFKWGLPHPDNSIGFAAALTESLLTGDANYFYLVFAESKAKAFDLVKEDVLEMFYILNLMEGYGKGGLSEEAWLSDIVESGYNPVVFTYMGLDNILYKRGTSQSYYTFSMTVAAMDYRIYKAPSTPSFLEAEAVEAGDIVELYYPTEDVTQKAIVTDVTEGMIAINKICLYTSSEVKLKIYKKYTGDELVSKYNASMGAKNEALYVLLAKGIYFGNTILSPKWALWAFLMLKLTLPEQQPSTKISLSMSNFGTVLGAQELFTWVQLDNLASNGFLLCINGSNTGFAEILVDVTAGWKTKRYTRGQGSAVIPALTFGATCQKYLRSKAGKSNKTAITKTVVQTVLDSIRHTYLTEGAETEYGAKLQVAEILSISGIPGGYAVNYKACGQEQANKFEATIYIEEV